MIAEFAPAKINLALHVTGRRDDGYHLLDSLVMFARDAGDSIALEPAAEFSLRIAGEHGRPLVSDSDDNLVLRATRAFCAAYPDRVEPYAMTLQKNLPVASGIGGGSSDAAATLRALARASVIDASLDDLAAIGLGLGADVPVCVYAQACRMSGIGENIAVWRGAPELHAVLVNSGTELSTADVFKALNIARGTCTGPPLPDSPGTWPKNLVEWLHSTRNDLEPAARMLAPEISDVLQALLDCGGCLLARMSGSGATCYGIFSHADAARRAATRLMSVWPQWWVRATLLS